MNLWFAYVLAGICIGAYFGFFLGYREGLQDGADLERKEWIAEERAAHERHREAVLWDQDEAR